jgi:F0F1-type ATP synthase assembly protein I
MTAFNKSDANMLRTAWELSAGMLSFVVAIGLGWWFGRVLDSWFGTAPWMVRLFTVFGVAAGVLNVYRTILRALRPLDAARGRPESTEGRQPQSRQ